MLPTIEQRTMTEPSPIWLASGYFAFSSEDKTCGLRKVVAGKYGRLYNHNHLWHFTSFMTSRTLAGSLISTHNCVHNIVSHVMFDMHYAKMLPQKIVRHSRHYYIRPLVWIITTPSWQSRHKNTNVICRESAVARETCNLINLPIQTIVQAFRCFTPDSLLKFAGWGQGICTIRNESLFCNCPFEDLFAGMYGQGWALDLRNKIKYTYYWPPETMIRWQPCTADVNNRKLFSSTYEAQPWKSAHSIHV